MVSIPEVSEKAAAEGCESAATWTGEPRTLRAAAAACILPPTAAWIAFQTGVAAAALTGHSDATGFHGDVVESASDKQGQQQQRQRGFYSHRQGEEQQEPRTEQLRGTTTATGVHHLFSTLGGGSTTTVVVSACGLSQWALDFKGNYIRVEESMRRAKAAGASIRAGPEVELSGYSCEDHYLEEDTLQHSWESLAALLSTDITDDLLCDVGIAVSFKSLRYNCRAWILNRRLLLLRPTTVLRDYGNYHESRYFTPWQIEPAGASGAVTSVLEEYPLPSCITQVNGQTSVPFGVALLRSRDGVVVGSVFLEELQAAAASSFEEPSVAASLVCANADVVCCCAAAHFQVGEYERRLRAVQKASQYCVFVYSNQQGCDGGRLFFDGTAAVCAAGEICGVVSRFSLEEMQVVATAVDLADLRSLRAAMPQAWKKKFQPQHVHLPVIHVDISLCIIPSIRTPALAGFDTAMTGPVFAVPLPLPPMLSNQHAHIVDDAATNRQAASSEQQRQVVPAAETQQGEESQRRRGRRNIVEPWVTAEEETASTAACWLWDCLRRSGACGFFLPLSGGADSAAVGAIVALMCKAVMSEVSAAHVDVVTALERVLACRCIYTSNSNNTRAGNPTTEEDTEGGGGSESGSAAGGDAEETSFPMDAKELCHALLYTCYMSTRHSSAQTRGLAASFANQIGSYHLAVEIDTIVAAFSSVMASVLGNSPRFIAQGGTIAEDVALQNIQARTRMVLSYFMAQLLPPAFSSNTGGNSLEQQQQRSSTGVTAQGPAISSNNGSGRMQLHGGPTHGASSPASAMESKSSFLLVLGTANADEGLRGYFTKYDASSADINPIGSMGKLALRRLLLWAAQPSILACPALYEIAALAPTAELRPATATGCDSSLKPQTDEEDMGMTYNELSDYGRLRKTLNCGPVSMFKRLLRERGSSLESQRPTAIAQKVMHFFRHYGRHRHKTCTLPPALHMDSSNAEDSRFDPRPFLYPQWNVQFEQIRKIALQLESSAIP